VTDLRQNMAFCKFSFFFEYSAFFEYTLPKFSFHADVDGLVDCHQRSAANISLILSPCCRMLCIHLDNLQHQDPHRRLYQRHHLVHI
jgi:hypothetical protein